VPRYEACTVCAGSGAKPGPKERFVLNVKVRVKTVVSNGFFQLAQTCSRCGGEGSTIATVCPECAGKVELKLPKR